MTTESGRMGERTFLLSRAAWLLNAKSQVLGRTERGCSRLILKTFWRKTPWEKGILPVLTPTLQDKKRILWAEEKERSQKQTGGHRYTLFLSQSREAADPLMGVWVPNQNSMSHFPRRIWGRWQNQKKKKKGAQYGKARGSDLWINEIAWDPY